MQLYQNPTILSESSVSVKLLLWAQDYCPVPKWQTQNTVRVIRVIAKPTTWKTSTVLVPSTQHITGQKLWRKCSIKVQPQWREYKYKLQFRCPVTLSYLFYSLAFSCPYFALTQICMSESSACAHAYSYVPLMSPSQVCVNTHIERYNHLLYLIYAQLLYVKICRWLIQRGTVISVQVRKREIFQKYTCSTNYLM